MLVVDLRNGEPLVVGESGRAVFEARVVHAARGSRQVARCAPTCAENHPCSILAQSTNNI